MVLSAGFSGDAYRSRIDTPAPISLAFWLQPISLIWLVTIHDGSDAPLLALSIDSCLKGFRLRLAVTAVSPRFTD
jgi:hypothetical protein